MATADQHRDRTQRDRRPAAAVRRHHGREPLAEVVMIRPARPERTGFVGLLVTLARVFASPPARAPSVRTPRPPSSPARLGCPPPRLPHDAA